MVARWLVQMGADINAQGGLQGCYGNALQAAAFRGSKDLVQLLLNSGADVNAQGDFLGNALQTAVHRT